MVKRRRAAAGAAAALAVLASLAAALLAGRAGAPTPERVTLAPLAAKLPAPTAARSWSTAAPRRPASPASAASSPPAAPAALGSNEVPDFDVDDRGNLVYGAANRNELERLIALNDRAQAQALLLRATAGMPAAAARQANDAFFAWQNYSIALARAFSPQQPVTDEAGAVQQLDALHALRVQQFGADIAHAYFGADEQTARRLLDEMQAQQRPGGAGFEERAERAQQQRSQQQQGETAGR